MNGRGIKGNMIDRVAIALSAMCALHCVATAVLLGALSSVGHLFASPIIHEAGLAIAIVLAAVAFYGGVRRHGALWPMIMGGSGLMLMTAALMVDHGMNEAILTVAGVLMVALGHYFNHRRAAPGR